MRLLQHTLDGEQSVVYERSVNSERDGYVKIGFREVIDMYNVPC